MKITICIGSCCHLKGSREIIEEFQRLAQENSLTNIDLSGAFCMKNCVNGVSVLIDDKLHSVTPENIRSLFYKEILKRI